MARERRRSTSKELPIVSKREGRKSPPPEETDVLVIGAGAAGGTVAGLLVRSGRKVLLIDRERAGDRSPMPRWISAGVEPILKKLGIPLKQVLAEPVRGVAFHSAEFDKHQDIRLSKRMAYFIDLAQWNPALTAGAVAAGTTYKKGMTVRALRMKEDSVTAECDDGESRSARLLVLADGVYSNMADAIGLQLRPATPRRFAAQLDWPADKASKLPPGTLNFVLGMEGGAALATYWSSGDREVATVFALDEATARARLDRVVRKIVDYGGAVLPRRADAAVAGMHQVPAGHSLEIECHVGKRSLAIGDAGGFVAAATCEGVYPAMWSAEIAAEIIQRSLDHPHPQDELREFDHKWRTTMADYLRPPNADLQFLLPLVFANKQMAERLAGAFLCGENL